ncbi:hypothetical protein Tco_0764340 [Tanacetum coccineum]
MRGVLHSRSILVNGVYTNEFRILERIVNAGWGCLRGIVLVSIFYVFTYVLADDAILLGSDVVTVITNGKAEKYGVRSVQCPFYYLAGIVVGGSIPVFHMFTFLKVPQRLEVKWVLDVVSRNKKRLSHGDIIEMLCGWRILKGSYLLVQDRRHWRVRSAPFRVEFLEGGIEQNQFGDSLEELVSFCHLSETSREQMEFGNLESRGYICRSGSARVDVLSMRYVLQYIGDDKLEMGICVTSFCDNAIETRRDICLLGVGDWVRDIDRLKVLMLLVEFGSRFRLELNMPEWTSACFNSLDSKSEKHVSEGVWYSIWCTFWSLYRSTNVLFDERNNLRVGAY